MRGTSLWILTIVCVIAGTSRLAVASPAAGLLDRGAAAQIMRAEQVDYTWNHKPYHHRAWDKEHKRWRYYN